MEKRLEAWLETKTGASITKFTRTYEEPVTDCKSCPCINGYTMKILASGDAEKKFLDLGFTKVP